MQYRCKVCGYIYDEAKEKMAFRELPEVWTCPLCAARKVDFEPVNYVKEEAKKEVVITEDMRKVDAKQLPAIFSNLARGSEKQYKDREKELFLKLALYFDIITPEERKHDYLDLLKMNHEDLKDKYPSLKSIGEENEDRGALRVKVWGEKVSNIISSLLKRYQDEGESFLEGKDVWVCSVCGFIYVGEAAPKLCPVCKVPDWKFDRIEGGQRQ